nr:family 43 glycosylhydrolase [Lachnospiraceae bacterium]
MKRKVLAGLLALSFVFEGAASPVLSVYAEEAKNAENAARDDETTTEETKSSNEKAMEMPEERSHYDMDGELPEGTEVLNKGLKEYTGDLEYGEGHSGESTDKALKTGKYGVKLPDTNVGDEYTVSFWMKQDGHSVTNTPTVFLGNNDPERWVGMSGADKGKSFKFWTNNADKTYKTYSHTTITEVDEDSENWRMYTISQKDNDVSVYVDGELIGNGTAAPALDGDNQGIYLGVNYWDSEFKGLIDDVTIFDEKLSDEQVKYLYDGNTEEEPAAETPAEEETDKNAEYLITEFNFNDAETGFVSGDYKAEGSYDSIAEGKNGNAVRMTRDVSQYLTVKDSNGKSPLTGLDEFTISYDFKPSDSTTSWSFFATPASATPSYQKEKYLGVLTNGGNTTVERYNNNGSRSATVTLGTKTNNWNHIDVVFEKNKTTLYVDKEKKAEVESEVDIKKLLGDDSVLWIGHANWGDGETLNGYLDNYKIYNKALSGEELDSTVKDPAKSKREDLNRKVDVKIESVEADYKEVLDVSADEAVSLETPAKVVFSDGISKNDASIVWTDKDGNTVSNTNALKAGTNELTGHLQYFSSPFIEEKADPYVIYNEDDGYYYFTSSWPAYRDVDHGYDRISLRRAKTIEGLAEAEEHVIWWHHTDGTAPRYHIWAPELHKVGNKWVVYFAGSEDPKGVWAIRPYAIVCNNPDDLLNPESWSDAKRFTNADGSYDENFDDFSLDMTTFNYQNEDYVIWAYKVNKYSSLKMGKLDSENPWKLKEGSETIVLTTPEYSWEKKDEIVNEGPSVLQTEDKIFVSFSASGTGPNYCMGLMMADQGSDLLDIENWTKTTQPILQSSDLYQQYGPGHNSFTKDKNGNDIIVYHARDEECYKGECGYAGVHPLYDPCRHAYLAYVRWSEDGIPVFSNTEYKETKDIEYKMTVNVGDDKDLVKADAAAITINGIEDGARGNITLPLVGENGSKITWKSSKPEVISDVEKDGKAAGVVTRQDKDTQVILTATVVSGNSSALRKISVNVKAKAEEKETTHYLFAHFTGTEQIYFSDSKDGLDWKMLNDGDPVLKSTLGEKGLRDPFIMRSPEG